jgi:HAMP domain-containing protein
LFLPMPAPEPTTTEAFLDRALPRMRRFMLVLAAIGTLIALVFFPWQVTAGFVVGAVISYFNQRWLERAIEALAERITTGRSQERGGAIMARAVLRYILIAGSAYVIFNVSHAGLYGFLGGVCLPIAAMACEVAVEALILLRRG